MPLDVQNLSETAEVEADEAFLLSPLYSCFPGITVVQKSAEYAKFVDASLGVLGQLPFAPHSLVQSMTASCGFGILPPFKERELEMVDPSYVKVSTTSGCVL